LFYGLRVHIADFSLSRAQALPDEYSFLFNGSVPQSKGFSCSHGTTSSPAACCWGITVTYLGDTSTASCSPHRGLRRAAGPRAAPSHSRRAEASLGLRQMSSGEPGAGTRLLQPVLPPADLDCSQPAGCPGIRPGNGRDRCTNHANQPLAFPVRAQPQGFWLSSHTNKQSSMIWESAERYDLKAISNQPTTLTY